MQFWKSYVPLHGHSGLKVRCNVIKAPLISYFFKTWVVQRATASSYCKRNFCSLTDCNFTNAISSSGIGQSQFRTFVCNAFPKRLHITYHFQCCDSRAPRHVSFYIPCTVEIMDQVTISLLLCQTRLKLPGLRGITKRREMRDNII